MTGLNFGTSGLRGLVVDFTDGACDAYCAAFLTQMAKRGHADATVLVGRDLRPSSPSIAASCLAAVARRGVPGVDCGAAPTPAIALEAMRRGASAIMVTGSHIPADRNGLKFYAPYGEIDKQDEAGINAALAAVENRGGPHEPTALEDGAVLEGFAARYRSFAGRLSLAGHKVGVYEHSAVARDLLPALLESLGAEVVRFGRSDAFVPVDTEAVDPDAATLFADFARAEGLTAIVSTDGDGDRPLVADEHGAVLRGDLVGLLAARFLGAETVVTPVTSTSAVETSGYFGHVVRTRVGSPYVIEGMSNVPQGRSVVGFEANGGVLLGSDVPLRGLVLSRLPTRDAFLPIIAVLADASERAGGSVARLAASTPRRLTASGRLVVPSETSSRWLDSLRSAQAARSVVSSLRPLKAIDVIDGVRMTLDDGSILHFRASGNAPELRCYTEASSQEAAETLLSFGLDRARHLVA